MRKTLLSLVLLSLFVFTGCTFGQTNILDLGPGSEQETENINVKGKMRTFTQEIFDADLGKKPVVLFFHATWCPTCNRVKADIIGDIDNMPEWTNILIADFDTEIDLRQKYEVLTQTTFVVFNAQGEETARLAVPSLTALKKAIMESN